MLLCLSLLCVNSKDSNVEGVLRRIRQTLKADEAGIAIEYWI